MTELRELLGQAAYAQMQVAKLRAKTRNRTGEKAPDEWQDWLHTLYPSYVSASFADRHIALWDWVWALRKGVRPQPFVGIWPRGGAKSTSAELATVAVGANGWRKYAWYICRTQEMADKHVETIASLLEAPTIARFYPQMSMRRLGKYGNVRGWRRQRLWCGNGYVIDALGLDVGLRGARVEENRPDFMIGDDLDDKLDTALTTQKKIDVFTTSVLPAGSSDLAVLAIQNLIIPDGIFSQIADGRAEFLADRIVSGPYPAVDGLEYEKDPEALRFRVTGGVATWEGQSLAVVQQQINTWGLSAFLQESQHLVSLALGGMFKREWFEIVDVAPREALRVRYWDKAGSIKKNSDYSAGVLMVRDSRGVFYVEDVIRGKWTALDREDIIKQTAQADDARFGQVPVWVEQEPGSSGLESAESTIRNLAGHVIEAEAVTGDKESRARPMAAQAQAKNVKLVAGAWNSEYLDELVRFPTGAHDDQVDASSGAFNKLLTPGWLID